MTESSATRTALDRANRTTLEELPESRRGANIRLTVMAGLCCALIIGLRRARPPLFEYDNDWAIAASLAFFGAGLVGAARDIHLYEEKVSNRYYWIPGESRFGSMFPRIVAVERRN